MAEFEQIKYEKLPAFQTLWQIELMFSYTGECCSLFLCYYSYVAATKVARHDLDQCYVINFNR
jgi:hypothetical protein